MILSSKSGNLRWYLAISFGSNWAPIDKFGIIAPQGIHRVEKLAAEVHNPAVPSLAREVLMLLVEELASIWRRIEAIESQLVACTELTRLADA
jgi:hypothetical protein